MTEADFMREALVEAKKAYDLGEIPIGAVLVHDGEIIARHHNRREMDHDATAHAEMLVIREACDALERWRLTGCTLYVTIEPCPMCAGACLQTHIGRIVFGAWDAKLGACGSVWDIPRDPHVGLVPEVIGGVREAECGRLMTDFFARRR
mgnify:CR=1 FL=1